MASELSQIPSEHPDDNFPLTCPDNFKFPFEPYSVQSDFMQNLFQTIEQREIGIFESPTGTGKSLSIICGALTWLKEYKKRMEKELMMITKNQQNVQKTKADDWLEADFQSSKIQRTLKERQKKLEESIKRELQWKNRRADRLRIVKQAVQAGDEISGTIAKIEKVLKESKSGVSLDSPDADLLLDEYESGEEDIEKQDNSSEDKVKEHVLKVIYCTRTHSQVSQFIKEIKRSPFGCSTRVVALASRQNLCVFEPVRKLKSVRLINERCVELQKGKTSKPKVENQQKKRMKKDPEKESKCPYYEKDAVYSLSDELLTEVLDIEESWKAGIEKIGCPYYASRVAVPDAEVVVVPYNLILHRPTREASGISLTDNIVILDEAHNIIEALTSMYGAEIEHDQIKMALFQVQEYRKRYQSRLTPNNLLRIQNLFFVLTQLGMAWKTSANDSENSASAFTEISTLDKFIISARLDSVNLFKVLEYCRKSLISRKLLSFATRYSETFLTDDGSAKNNTDLTGSSPLMAIESFLETLTNSNSDGRIVRTRDRMGKCRLKFLLLNPAIYVKDIFREARSVIFAGGTMQPVSDFENQLLKLADVNMSRVHHFSCGHVIPPNHVLPIVLQKGPSGKTFEFTYQNRGSEDMLLQLGRLIQNLSNIVPGGVVCFFPSYDFEDTVFRLFTKTPDLLKNIDSKKQIFREPKRSCDVEGTLRNYAASIKVPTSGRTGAIMFAVVGGKLSEGINFSDDLARCVIMVGLPFPNSNCDELKEKMKFLDLKLARASDGRPPSKQYYENLCMKAVNQSIGRAIRHAKDYAVILLADVRYGNANIRNGLPQWIGNQLQVPNNFASAFGSIKRFFTEQRR